LPDEPKRRSGRDARLAARAARPAVNPCPPGQIGGSYKPLTEPEMEQIVEAALVLLNDLGMGEVPERLSRDLAAAGAVVSGLDGRVRLPPSMVRSAMKSAAKQFVLHGRDPTRSITVGGSHGHFGTGGAAVQTLDLDKGLYRASTLADLHDYARLQDRLANVSWFTRCCVATSFTIAEHVAPIVEMLGVVAGGSLAAFGGRDEGSVQQPQVVGLATNAGFALSKYKLRGQLLIFTIFVGGNFVPFQILMVPVLRLTQDIGIYNTKWALILFHFAFQTGLCVFFMRNFIARLPSELIEAARVEGANEWQIFWRIVLPLVRPVLAALSVLIFTSFWNDFFWSLVPTPASPDGVLALADLNNIIKGRFYNAWNVMAAGSLLVALPPVAMFFFLQKQFIAGLTLGANKR